MGMTKEEAKVQIEYRKDFATPAQIEALNMAQNALDEIEKYKQIIEDIKAEINSPNRNTCDYFIVDQIEKIVEGVSE